MNPKHLEPGLSENGPTYESEKLVPLRKQLSGVSSTFWTILVSQLQVAR